MKYLVRKFSKPKWTLIPTDTGNYRNLQAEVLSTCIRTSQNTLSVWGVDTNEWDEIKPVLAALFSSSDNPTRTDVIILEANAIEHLGIELQQTDGITPAVDEVNKLHFNLIDIDLNKVEAFASLMYSENTKAENPFIRRFREKEVIEIVKSSIAAQQIDPDKLKGSWSKHIA